MPPTEGVVPILLSTTSRTQTTLKGKLLLDSWQLWLQANQVCLSPESSVLSPIWHSLSHRSSPRQSGCLSAQVRGAHGGQSPASSTAASRHSATEFSQVKQPLPVQLSSGRLDLLSLSTTSFLSQHQLPFTGPSIFTRSLHSSSRILIYPSSLLSFLSHPVFFFFPFHPTFSFPSTILSSLPLSFLSFFLLPFFHKCLWSIY